MNRVLIAALACLVAGTAQATCIYPRKPDKVPDGNTATREEMVEAQKAVQQFDADVAAYNACLDMEMAAYEKSGQYDPTRLEELRAIQAKKNNAAVDEVQAVADAMNEQIRVYNQRNKSE